MNAAFLAAFGWLVPGGVYLVRRRYLQFAIALTLVCCATVAGLAMQGANLWPKSAELQGLDGFAMGMARAGALIRILAGGPYVLGRLFDYSHTFLSGQTHEYGTTLLVLAGLFNLLALADGLGLQRQKMIPHLLFTLLLASLVSAATALPGHRDAGERLGAAAYTFVSCTLAIFAGSWLMYFIHG